MIVEPLSKTAELLSPSMLPQAMFSGPLHQVSGLGFKKRTFWDVLRLWEPHLGMLSDYWFLRGLASLLFHPLFYIETHFLGALAEVLRTIFHEIVRTTTSKAISVFFSSTAEMHWQNEQYTQLTDLLHQSHLRFLGPLHLKTQQLLFSLPLCLSLLQLSYFPP